MECEVGDGIRFEDGQFGHGVIEVLFADGDGLQVSSEAGVVEAEHVREDDGGRERDGDVAEVDFFLSEFVPVSIVDGNPVGIVFYPAVRYGECCVPCEP